MDPKFIIENPTPEQLVKIDELNQVFFDFTEDQVFPKGVNKFKRMKLGGSFLLFKLSNGHIFGDLTIYQPFKELYDEKIKQFMANIRNICYSKGLFNEGQDALVVRVAYFNGIPTNQNNKTPVHLTFVYCKVNEIKTQEIDPKNTVNIMEESFSKNINSNDKIVLLHLAIKTQEKQTLLYYNNDKKKRYRVRLVDFSTNGLSIVNNNRVSRPSTSSSKDC